MSLNNVRENKILVKIFKFRVMYQLYGEKCLYNNICL